MPYIYLSPSTQQNNKYVSGGSEEHYMNLIADAMTPYLRANTIRVKRNAPTMTASSSIAQSNAGNYGLHLALHSNAAPPNMSGAVRGTDVYYYPGSTEGKRAAEIIAKNLKAIYPIPSLVRIKPTMSIGEVRLPRAPSVFIEFAYHDNPEDAAWIVNNINTIARNVVQALAEYFGLPYVEPLPPRAGTVNVSFGGLNIRSKPSLSAPIVSKAYNGQSVTVLGNTGNGWYSVEHNGVPGYVSTQYIRTP